MKFNNLYSKYKTLYVENAANLPILQGDQVIFKKNWDKLPYFESLRNSSTGQRIREMIDQKEDPLIATAIKANRPTSFGAHGSPEQNSVANESEFVVTVAQQYALGLYSNIVEVPMIALERVDNGNNLTPLSNNQNGKEYKQNYKGEAPKIDKTLSDPTSQTHASWRDHGGKLPS